MGILYKLNMENNNKTTNISATARVFGALPNIGANIVMLGNLVEVSSEIQKRKKHLKYHAEGVTICRIGFMELAGTNEEKLDDITLETGVECLKSLSDSFIDDNKAMSQEQKQKEKNTLHLLWDSWKEEAKKAFKEENKWNEL